MSNRDLTKLVAAGVAAFAVFVAVGTYFKTGTVVPGVIIVACALAFLALWLASYRVAQRQAAASVTAGEPTASASLTCIGGFLLSITAWALAIAGDFFTIATSRGALLLLTLTASTCLAAFMLAVIGISNPAQRPGKGLGIFAAAAAVGLVATATVRLIVGM